MPTNSSTYSGRRAGFPQGAGVADFKAGDYVRIGFLPQATSAEPSVWMFVQKRDDRHAIIYGLIDDDNGSVLGKAIRHGAKLAASYRQIREIRTIHREEDRG